MKHLTHMNEFLGFSAKEKAEKQKKLDIEQLKIELSKYNWLRMTAQPGNWANEDLSKLIKHRLYQGKQELPYLYKLVPQLFEFKGNGTNAVRCLFKLSNNTYDGIIPASFTFAINPKNNTVEDTEETRERVLNFILQRYINE